MDHIPQLGKRQQGAALAICLLLLVVMTISGVATLNQSRVSEKVASNSQQKVIVFETAESVINLIASSEDFNERLMEARLLSMNDPAPLPQLDEANLIEVELDQSNLLGVSVDVDAEAEIQFCEERIREGTEMSADEGGDPADIGYRFDVRSTTTIENSRARAEHVLRVEIGGKRFGADGDCYTPGT